MRDAVAIARGCEQAMFILRPIHVRPSIVIAVIHCTLLFSLALSNVATATTLEKSAQTEKSCLKLL